MAVNPLLTATDGLLGGGQTLAIAVRGLLGATAQEGAILPSAVLQIVPVAPQWIYTESVVQQVDLPAGLRIFFDRKAPTFTYTGNRWVTGAAPFNIAFDTRTPSGIYTNNRFSGIDTPNIGLIQGNPQFATTENIRALLASSGLGISTQAPKWLIPYEVFIDSQNIGFNQYSPETLVPYQILLNGQSIQLTPEQVEAVRSDFQASELPASPLELLTRQIELVLGEISDLPEITIEIESLIPGTTLTNEAILQGQTLDLTPRLPEVLLGEMSLLDVPNLELDSRSVVAYTLPTGQEVWSEKVRYTLYLTKRKHFNIKR